MARTVTGIDVGSRSSQAIRGQYKGNTFHVSGFAAWDNPGGSLGEAWSRAQLPFKLGATVVGLTGKDVNIRYTRVPRVPDWQLRNLMRFEVAEIGGQSGSEVSSDFNLLPELPEIEGEDVVLLAMARESLLDEHFEGLTEAGGTIEAFAPSAIALYNAYMRYAVVEDDTVLIANIGHENTDVCICRGPDLVFARNLSGGSRLFDDAIAQRFNVGAQHAEKLKKEMATLRPGAQYPSPNHERASRAIMGAAGQVLSLLQSSVMFCKSQIKLAGLQVDRVLICGGGAALDGLPEYLASGMGMRVELFDAFRVVETAGMSEAEVSLLEEYKLEAVIALGLATMASDPESYSIEILPAAVAKRREFMAGPAWLIAAAVLAIAYLGFYGVTQKRLLEEVQARSRAVTSQLKKAKSVHQRTEALLDENGQLEELSQELTGLAGSGEQLARAMRVLEDALPGDFWITQMSSTWSYEPELGIERGFERPVLTLKGRAREGTDSPAVLYQGFVTQLREAIPQGRYVEALTSTGDSFSLDMTLYAPVEEEEVDEDSEEGAQ